MRRLGPGGLLSLAFTLTTFPQTNEITVVSAASFSRGGPLAPDMIVTAFSTAVPDEPVSAEVSPLPTSLGGLSVVLRDSSGVECLARLIARSRPAQLYNAVCNGGGRSHADARSSRRSSCERPCIRRACVSRLFTANASGDGPPAGLVLNVMPDGSRVIANLFEQWSGHARYAPRPFDVSSASGELYLLLFGTGLRGARDLPVAAHISGIAAPVQALQAQGTFDGLDQVNIGPLPPEISGRRGTVNLVLTVGGVTARALTINANGFPSAGSAHPGDNGSPRQTSLCSAKLHRLALRAAAQICNRSL